MDDGFVLPDVLEPTLNVVFCGTAAGKVSAEQEAYYAHPNNKFWKVLFESGLTVQRLKPHEFCRVLEFKIGLTDICKDVYGSDNEIRRATDLDRAGLRRKIDFYRPKFLAFTSHAAGKHFCGYRSQLGLQKETIGQTQIFILPSTSPMAGWNWSSTSHHWFNFAALVN
jgi:TDG/mug DNA glycosylase family protein